MPQDQDSHSTEKAGPDPVKGTVTASKLKGDMESCGRQYLCYLETCLQGLATQEKAMGTLFELLVHAKEVHIFGFGRSGAAALSLAIRLKHFGEYLPPVWWIGDSVRPPIQQNDLVILFSRSGERPEVRVVAEKARSRGARIALVTSDPGSEIGSYATLRILIPKIRGVEVYGGGDFELAAYFLQELFVTAIGKNLGIPNTAVENNHV